MTMNHFRNERLIQLSQMVMNGEITHKIDQIATIYINGNHYFNVFRRYNSPYNIVLEDMNGDFHYHQDHTVRTSLKSVLCLNDYDTASIYTWSVTSYKHNGPIYSMPQDIADMRWTEIQLSYQAVNVNFRGIFEYYQEIIPSTPLYQEMDLPVQQNNCIPDDTDDTETSNILVTLTIPHIEEEGEIIRQVVARKLFDENTCYCNCDCDESDDDSWDENNYTILRNGTAIPKPANLR